MSYACAGLGGGVGPGDIPRLESAAAQPSPDAGTLAELGTAYASAERWADAIAVLERATALEDAPDAAFFTLGVAHEEVGDWASARAAYEALLERGAGRLEEDARSRLALVAREGLKQQARLALQREAELSQQPPEPRSVAVFPFHVAGGDERLAPLEAALADMVITDLQMTGVLTLLERVRVNALLDEMVLSAAGYTSAETAVRAGRLLRAQHVVQGVLTPSGDDGIRMDVAVLEADAGRLPGELGGERDLDAIFDLEKEVVFRVLDLLGVSITEAERELIAGNRTESLLAFLAYGRGLQALDEGDYGGAAGFFGEASSLDPSFAPARAQLESSQQLQSAAAAPRQQIAVPAAAPEAVLDQVAAEINSSPIDQLDTSGAAEETTKSATERNSAQEAQQKEGVSDATKATVKVTVRNPFTPQPFFVPLRWVP